ncbi:amylo-Alpha-1,6-Glucosidase (plasmid) [Arthrobacter sp. Hiyo8]|nr:amylo-Alpha-1,6-Glucosidase [Arthrobacter sp. Hiyo8]GAP60728.1 amylo-Alpha-1,6-Glucosidase [Arthrobacter sp. Hiyo1]
MAGWNADTAAGPLGTGTVTLVEGTSFCISLPNGDIWPDHPHGLFFQDTRILSRWGLFINGQVLEPLTAQTKEPYRAIFASRVSRLDGYADTPLIVERTRELGIGIVEHITVHNHATEPKECLVSLAVDADFADVFEVKEARIQRQWEKSNHADGNTLTMAVTSGAGSSPARASTRSPPTLSWTGRPSGVISPVGS